MDVSHQPLGPNQTKWIEALESEKYDQCSGRLFDGEGYCCLGVGARVFLGAPEVSVNEDGNHYLWGFEADTAPKKLEEKLSLATSTGTPIYTRFTEEQHQASQRENENFPEIHDLVHLNDELEWTFPQIAAHLRKFAHLYFKEPR